MMSTAMTPMQIGETLSKAGMLKMEVLCVYSSASLPEGAVPLAKINRCVTKAIMSLAIGDRPPAYISNEALGGCCPGGQSWLGYIEFPQLLKHFISTGHKDFRNGAAEYLKMSPELVDESRANIGKITPLPGNLIIRHCMDLEEDPGVRSFLLFATAEQTRNICALNHFCTSDAFGSAIIPWGPTCASFITYPAGMAEKAPKDALFVGPVDPTGNEWFPTDLMAISMSMATARRLCDACEQSFISKRPKVAYPEKREVLQER
jgi:hypothetical protein